MTLTNTMKLEKRQFAVQMLKIEGIAYSIFK
jgi:hypothetical protein